MNLHIMPDDKFIDEFISVANEVNPESNTFLVNATDNPHYVKSKGKNVYLAKYGTGEFSRIVGDLSQYERVYIHFLTQEMCSFINKNAHKKVMFLWLFWGGDLYEHITYPLLDESTQRYVKMRNRAFIPGLLMTIKSWRAKQREHSERLRAIQRLSYILHFDEGEYRLVQKYFPTQAKYLFFSYPNVLQFDLLDQPLDIDIVIAVTQERGIDLTKKILLLGNSGWEVGNHLSVLQGCAASKKDDYQIVVPLSYGNPDYIDYVIAQGKKLLGSAFVPLTTFLAPQIYSQLIKVAEAGVFNSRRTQGVGNIIALLYVGKQVFLNPVSLYYHFLCRRGVKVYSVDQLFSKEIEPLDSLSAEKNREIIKDMY